jgi:hypothetical protein
VLLRQFYAHSVGPSSDWRERSGKIELWPRRAPHRAGEWIRTQQRPGRRAWALRGYRAPFAPLLRPVPASEDRGPYDIPYFWYAYVEYEWR